MELNLSVRNIRNIQKADLTFPLDRGLYALVGENGCGKSTIMLLMSLIVKTSSAHLLTNDDIDEKSTLEIITDSGSDKWYYNHKSGKFTTGKYTSVPKSRKTKKAHSALIVSSHWPGFYEGSIFYGCRFDDFENIDGFINDANFSDNIKEADDFVITTLGYILHNDKTHYKKLFKVKSREIAEKYGFKGVPYFAQYNGHTVSQFKMSSGECLLISLIDFINNLIIKGNHFKKFLFLIDEVELALHPAAIDRLFIFLNELVQKSTKEIVVYFSTHSSELIHRISPKNIYLIENIEGEVSIINPCYPNYAIRSLYVPNGFDFLLLVEDEMTKAIVEKTIRCNNLSRSKLCCVLPAGGCMQMLKLHHDMLTYNTLGVGKQIISIYDGDVKDNISSQKEYSNLPKCFLPIPSVEKYLKKKLVEEPDSVFIKQIGDKYFNQRSLPNILKDYKNDPRTLAGKDSSGKNLYSVIIANIEKSGLAESEFIKYLADDIYDYENPDKFVKALKALLE